MAEAGGILSQLPPTCRFPLGDPRDRSFRSTGGYHSLPSTSLKREERRCWALAMPVLGAGWLFKARWYSALDATPLSSVCSLLFCLIL